MNNGLGNQIRIGLISCMFGEGREFKGKLLMRKMYV